MQHRPPSQPSSKPSNLSEQIHAAKTLHQAGHIAEAESIYQAILAADKDNAEVMGLLAVVAHYRGDLKHAKKLWRRAIATTSPAWILLRNLHSLIQVLLKEGLTHEASKLARQDIPGWPAVRVPEPSERDMLISLAEILAFLEEADAASRLLESVMPSIPKDFKLLHTLGKLQVLKGNMSSAWEKLSAADNAMQPQMSFSLLTDLYQCAKTLGDRQAMQALKSRVITECPVLIDPKRPGQKAEILVLNALEFKDVKSERQLHFNGNYPSQICDVLAEEFHFSSVFAESQAGRAAAAEKLPQPDLIINNITNGESILSEGNLSTICEFADHFGVPVVNHPSNAVLTTRDKSVQLISDIPGVIAPQTIGFSKTGKEVNALVEEIEAEFAYPLITRSKTSQQGAGMTKIKNRDDLIKILSTPVLPVRTGVAGIPEEFFVTAFVDSRGPTGFYRKIRAAIVGDEILIIRVDFDIDWNVHARKSDSSIAFYRANPNLLVLEDRICSDPDKELGKQVMQTLRAIRERIPLEVGGIDFDVTTDGRVVFYEANATMNLLNTVPPEVRYPKHAEDRLVAALRRFLSDLAVARKPHTTSTAAGN